MIGLGAGDDLEEARAFVKRHGLSFRMLWDPDYDSWNEFGVRSTPSALLVTREGTDVKGWENFYDGNYDEVVRLAGESRTCEKPRGGKSTGQRLRAAAPGLRPLAQRRCVQPGHPGAGRHSPVPNLPS